MREPIAVELGQGKGNGMKKTKNEGVRSVRSATVPNACHFRELRKSIGG